MKRKISLALLLALLLSLALVVFTGCSGKSTGEKQVPVYQGMTITNSNTATLSLMSASYRSTGITLLSANHEDKDDNGNHNGHYKGDHTDHNDAIDEENPYPDNGENENIEEEIKSSLNVIGSPNTIYYAEPNQDIYINIHIDNPDSFEIMSFTLNGKKYSSYMFEEGSDMETIVLKYNVGAASGIVEYTIDAIKYIDGTEIKDVIIDGNKTVMAGVKTENKLAASVADVDIATNALSFNVNIKDRDNLISFSGGVLKAVIYDGFEIVAEKDLALGENSVSFDSLKTNTLYQYAVIGYYDDLSGDGFKMNVLYKDAFYTDSVVLFDNITVGQENVSFSFLWHEDHVGRTISALKLYQSDRLVETLPANATSVANLLSNNKYKLVAEYPNGENTESIYIEFTTAAKATPIFTVKNENITTEGINAEYDITDVDSILSNYKVELYKGDTLVLENPNKEIDFAGLNYYTDYTVRFTYKYNLNDGNGEKTVTYDYTFKTLPYIDVTECSIANTSAVSEGETIFMSVKLDNPLGMTIESVLINGETYNVTGASTKNKIFVEITYNGQFAGGDTYLKIDKVNAKMDNISLSIEPKTELSDNVFINGKLEVLRVEFVNDKFEAIDWAFPSDTVYVLITLDNSTAYTIDSINNLKTDWIKMDDNRIYKAVSGSFGWNEFSLTNLKYHNEYINKTLSIQNMNAKYYKVISDEIKYISSPNDLKNMVDGNYYELKNDIDLAGIEWIGSNCIGVFNGGGYTIKNMSFVGTTTNSSLGLFNRITGVVSNLNIIDATVIAEVNSTNERSIYLGFLGIEIDGILKEIIVKDSVVSVTNSHGGVYIGGIVCRSDGKIEQCAVVDCSVSIGASSKFHVGGIVGQNFGTVDGCYFKGTMNCQSTYYSGIQQYGSPAISGMVANNSGTVTNCFAIGTITADSTQSVGGIIGNNVGYVHFNVSNISFIDCKSSYLGGVCGDTWNEGKVSCNFTNIAAGAIGGTYNDLDAENNFSINDMRESEFYDLYLKNNKSWALEGSKILFVK